VRIPRYRKIKDNNNDGNGDGGEVNNTPSAVCWCKIKVDTSRCIIAIIIIIVYNNE